MFDKWKDNDCFLPFLELKKEKYPKTIITENNWRLHSQDPLNQESANTFCRRVGSKQFRL